MPCIRRLPKRGFNNARFRTSVPVNLSDLEKHFMMEPRWMYALAIGLANGVAKPGRFWATAS